MAMMTGAPDPHRSALALIDRHGDQAAIHAAMEADAMLEAWDLDGAAHWRRVVAAVNDLQDAAPAATVH
ncbi:MAG: hypothetical protein KAR37_12105 [Alphaproteobacteria bacterium]|nr:hypothetical protein [Alphaproteobacteria bacterium]